MLLDLLIFLPTFSFLLKLHMNFSFYLHIHNYEYRSLSYNSLSQAYLHSLFHRCTNFTSYFPIFSHLQAAANKYIIHSPMDSTVTEYVSSIGKIVQQKMAHLILPAPRDCSPKIQHWKDLYPLTKKMKLLKHIFKMNIYVPEGIMQWNGTYVYLQIPWSDLMFSFLVFALMVYSMRCFFRFLVAATN